MTRWGMPSSNKALLDAATILTTPEECEGWMTASWEQARALQRPLPDGTLRIVARGVKKDGEALA